jgi:hypothetical protein
MICGSVRAVVGRCNGSIGWISTLEYEEKQTWIDSARRAVHFPESRRESDSGTGAPLPITHLVEISFCSLFSSEILTHMQPDLKV